MWTDGDPKLAREGRSFQLWSCVAVGLVLIAAGIETVLRSHFVVSIFLLPNFLWPARMHILGRQEQKVKTRLRGGLGLCDVFDVWLSIRIGKMSTGNDFGYLWFEDDQLCFEGNQCSIRLDNSLPDLKGEPKEWKSDWKKVNDNELSFSLSDGTEMAISFRCDRMIGLVERMRAWQDGPISARPSVLPPVGMNPRMKVSAYELILKLEGILLALGMAGFLIYTADPSTVIPAYCLAAFWLAVSLAIGVFSVLHIRRRLAVDRLFAVQ